MQTSIVLVLQNGRRAHTLFFVFRMMSAERTALTAALIRTILSAVPMQICPFELRCVKPSILQRSSTTSVVMTENLSK